MNLDSEIKWAARSKFVRALTLAVIRNIQIDGVNYSEREVIDADLVPKFSERVVMASLKEKKVEIKKDEKKKVSVISQDFGKLVEPVERVPRGGGSGGQEGLYSGSFAQQGVGFQTMPMQGMPGQGYGKIDPLLRDPSVSSIECSGADKNLTIIRAGQRQMTKIILSLAEINQLLGIIADRAHVPLIQGVFRAAVDNFMIDAVFSDMVSPKFVIRKQTPYAMLEQIG
jgi:hypothetical protein